MKENWKNKRIEQCFKVKSGNFLPANKMAKEGSIDVYGGNGIAGKHNQNNLTGENIIIGRVGAKCGNVKRVSGNIWVTDNAFYISEFTEEFDLRFLEYLLSTKNLGDTANQTAQPVISYKTIKNVILVIPPLDEQKRITAILNEAFEGIDQAIRNTEKNLANARELFESSLQFIFSNQGKHWLRLQLSELLERKWITSHLDGNHGGDYPKKDEFIDSGVPYISANCLKNESVDMSLAKYLTPERADLLRKGIAQNNDILFAHNATVGPVAVLRTNEIKIILSTSLTYYRCDPRYIIPKYLALYMRSNEFKSQYEAVMRQSTRNQVPITKQRTFYHIVPPIEEQEKIANHLNDLFMETQRLKTIYRQKIAALNELKQSILQKAFTGQLTSKNC